MALAYHKNSKMPGQEDLDPSTGCCWWFSRMNYAWELRNLSSVEDFDWWIPYQDIMDPYS